MFSGGAFHELRTRQELQRNIWSDKLENEGNEIASPLIFKRTLWKLKMQRPKKGAHVQIYYGSATWWVEVEQATYQWCSMQRAFLNDFVQVPFEDTPDFPETNTERMSETETVGDSGPFGIFQGALWVRS